MGQLRGFQKIYTPLGLLIAYFVWQIEGFWTAVISLITLFILKAIIGWGSMFLLFQKIDNFNENHLLISGHIKNIVLLIFFYVFFFGFQLPISKNYSSEFIENTTKKDFLNIVLEQQRERDFEYTKKALGYSSKVLGDINECVSNKFNDYMELQSDKFDVLVPNFQNQEEMNNYAMSLLKEEELMYSYHTFQCSEIYTKK